MSSLLWDKNIGGVTIRATANDNGPVTVTADATLHVSLQFSQEFVSDEAIDFEAESQKVIMRRVLEILNMKTQELRSALDQLEL